MSDNFGRTHDKETYLRESRYTQPKEYFKLLVDRARAANAISDGSSVVDFGCAAGEFLYYLHDEFPTVSLTGYDVVPELIEKARAHVPGVTFELGSVLDPTLFLENSLDVAFLLGVHSIFDDFRGCFSNLMRWTRPGGHIYIFGLFNPFPLDVWVSFRRHGVESHVTREPGWNMFSKSAVSEFIEQTLGPNHHTFIPFEMPFDIATDPTDLVRSWTMIDEKGRRHVVNGLSLLCNLELLELRP